MSESVIYNPYVRHEKLDVLIQCMERVVEESPPAYKETAGLLLNLLKSKNKGTGIYPETFMAMSNRGGGKTYPFTKCLLYAAMDHGFKIGLLCRTKTQMGNHFKGVFGATLDDVFPEWTVSEKICSNMYGLVTLSKEEEVREIGYVLPLNAAGSLKDHSSRIKDCDVLFLDEFQSTDSIPDEMKKYDTMHLTVARGSDTDGNDYGTRYLPTVLCSNSLSITNKYMAFFGLMNKIQKNTKLYRGEGISLLRFKNEIVADNQRRTAYHRSKIHTRQDDSDLDNAWLNDSDACIGKPQGQSYYMATVIDGNVTYGVHYYYEAGMYYIGRNVDKYSRRTYVIQPGGQLNTATIRTAYIFQELRDAYSHGLVMFADQGLKALIDKIYIY